MTCWWKSINITLDLASITRNSTRRRAGRRRKKKKISSNPYSTITQLWNGRFAVSVYMYMKNKKEKKTWKKINIKKRGIGQAGWPSLILKTPTVEETSLVNIGSGRLMPWYLTPSYPSYIHIYKSHPFWWSGLSRAIPYRGPFTTGPLSVSRKKSRVEKKNIYILEKRVFVCVYTRVYMRRKKKKYSG